jgi:putative ATPase
MTSFPKEKSCVSSDLHKEFSMICGVARSAKHFAKIIAGYVDADFHQISAVSAGVKEVRAIIDRAALNRSRNRATILFIDEIHRFNKAQQDALLHAVEDGSVTLIGATTENPSFEVIAPLISRCRVLKLAGLADNDLAQIIDLAIAKDIVLLKYAISFEPGAKDFLIKNVNGDARKLLNAIEICQQLAAPAEGTDFIITTELIKEALQQRRQLYDKTGDYHYDIISAFIKSVRGSDPDAAVYWMALMLEGGEDPLFIARRLIITGERRCRQRRSFSPDTGDRRFSGRAYYRNARSRHCSLTGYDLSGIHCKSNASYMAWKMPARH